MRPLAKPSVVLFSATTPRPLAGEARERVETLNKADKNIILILDFAVFVAPPSPWALSRKRAREGF
jgi:hypothetical protein